MNQRCNPDKLLKHVQTEEKNAGRGRLKLFFGASPGVGKTYAMLEAARQHKKDGWDVVIGLVETHKRAETEALLKGFEMLPRKEIEYKGVVLQEFDLDGALKRHPRLMVVDELAHANAPGLRHAKRWQDIEELLNSGIDVYTTLNVQHWETLNDVVAQITGVVVRETVPDTFLNQAHELELVDLAPEDLLKRLKDGKVYQGELAGHAADHFFKLGNLIALRELALRHTAERVDAQMQAFKERNAIDEIWEVGERLLVGISSSPMSARLIRATSRLATRLRAPWIAVFVETSVSPSLSEEERNRAVNNMRLAERLGAETVTLNGDDVTQELLTFAMSRNVTRIVLGKPARPRWKELISGSIVNEVARRCGNIDLHVISGTDTDIGGERPRVKKVPADWAGVGQAVAIVALATVICWPLSQILDRVNLIMVYLLGIIGTAYYFGRKASLLASVLSVLFFDFFFVPPQMSFTVADTQYLVTFFIMLGTGLLISTITSRLRRQTETLRNRAERMRVLYQLSRNLSETPEKRQLLGSAAGQLEEYYRLPILILTANAQGNLEVGAGDAEAFCWNENEVAVSRWVLEKGQIAGAGSDTLAGAKGLYVPLKGLRGTTGVLGIRPKDPKALLEPEQIQLLETFAAEIGGALESTRMSEEIGRAEIQMEIQAMKASKLDIHLRVGNLLSERQIRILPSGLSKDQIIRELLARLRLPNPAQALQAILEREKAGPTVIGNAIAAPHARVPGLDGLQLALGVVPGDALRLWFVFISPTADPMLHLNFLASLSFVFRDADFVSDIAALRSPQIILERIREREVSIF